MDINSINREYLELYILNNSAEAEEEIDDLAYDLEESGECQTGHDEAVDIWTEENLTPLSISELREWATRLNAKPTYGVSMEEWLKDYDATPEDYLEV